ncbi:XRE family transcriptional regulator [Pararhodonellum marinum]|uniref:XRE family transcriptional regulator n=1 Tax=Pararhodonellum marinum TaxID=2755358 RepID=UPI00188DDFE4|nr:LexA family transcriptional regulator [Pararhodonellum marinum]
MFLDHNLRFLRKQKGWTQQDLADQLAVQRTMISAYEDGRSEPKLSTLKLLGQLFSISIDELLHHDIEKSGRKVVQDKDIRVLTVSVDQEGEENITFVKQKASAGYLNGFADPEYMESLPQFNLPHLSRSATYRAFEISGDSMLPLVAGTIIIGAYVDQLKAIKSGKTYVLVTASEGVVYKRVFNYLDENGKLYLVSDNELYKPYEIRGEEVMEIWEAKAFISTDFPNPKDKINPVTLEDISNMIVELRRDIVKLK